jgi:hypothetical protein
MNPNIAIDRTISANGTIALWELSGAFDLSEVRAAFTRVGLDHVAPYARTPAAALHAALVTIYGKRGTLVRPCGEGAFVVVEDVPVPGELRMDRKDVQGARVNFDGTLTIRENENKDRIRSLYQQAQGQIDTDALGTALSSAISTLHGTPVRSRGGVYWVPGQKAATWRALATELAALSNTGGIAALYSVTTVGDADTIKAISAAFSREADSLVASVTEDLKDASPRVAQNRARKMHELAMLAEHYEEVLGASLKEIRERIEVVAAEAGQAAILA